MRKPITKSELTGFNDTNVIVNLVDIRSVGEYDALHIPGAINIPAEELETRQQSFTKNDTIICICNHGKERSQRAAEQLYNLGFQNTYYLAGGVAAWFDGKNEAVVTVVVNQPAYSLTQLTRYFLKLGYSGFGGPVALVGYMRRDLVEKYKWISEEEYKEGLALAQLAPGPLAAQLGIYLGFVHYGVLGATLAGLAFVLPSFIMVVLLGIAYKMYGGLPWMQAVFYGVGAAVIGIIAMSAYKLTIKSVGKLNLEAIKKNWMLWLFYIVAAAITVITQTEEVLLFVIAGLLYMIIKAPPAWMRRPAAIKSIFLAGIGFWIMTMVHLEKLQFSLQKRVHLFLEAAWLLFPFCMVV
jgi:chromate transport protein ChrA/rhodanese-related sulfurtransferase